MLKKSSLKAFVDGKVISLDDSDGLLENIYDNLNSKKSKMRL